MRSQTRLTAQAWADEALDVIAEGGLAALSVEGLARRLGVTKGSFYWHFSNQPALVLVALARWELQETEEIVRDLGADPDPRRRLRRFLERAVTPGGESAVLGRLLALTESAPRRAVQRATERRTAFLARIFGELGFPAAAGRTRAEVTYATYLGIHQMASEPRPGADPAAAVAEAVRLLAAT